MSELIRHLMGTLAPGTFTLPTPEAVDGEQEEEEERMVYKGPVTLSPALPPVQGPDGRWYAQRVGMTPFPTHASHGLYPARRRK
jgi:hypothetical protein